MREARSTLDSARTIVDIRTISQGAFAALAHDLALRATGASGFAERDDGGDRMVAELQFPVAGIVVRGTVHGDTVDERALSAADRAEIERRIRGDVFRGASKLEVHIESTGDLARATIRWESHRAEVSFLVRIVDGPGGAQSASGRFSLSLAALGVQPIFGPLRAFRVADPVAVRFEAVFQ